MANKQTTPPECTDCGKSHAFINEWEGWWWQCVLCGSDIRKATDKEIKNWEEGKASL